MAILIKTPQQINIMRRNGRVLAKILRELKKIALPGISGKELENLANRLIKKHGGMPSFRGFNGYPYALCFSLNNEIVHAAPLKNKFIKKGDLVSLDLGFFKDSFHTDAAISFIIPPINPQAKNLLETTKRSLDMAIKSMRPGIRLGKISHLIQTVIEKEGFSVIKELTGHGVGKKLHEDPYVFNYGLPDSGPILKEGMVLAIEPMASLGSSKIKDGKDGFSYETKDGSLSAHFEHTLAITRSGCEVLTK